MKYRSSDYYLLFQTNGVNFFFADLCTKYYDKFSGVTISKDGQWGYYVHLTERTLAKESYKKFYKDSATVEESCRRFLNKLEEAQRSKDDLLNAEEVDIEAFDTFVSQSAVLMDEYSKLDHMYTDFLFGDDGENKQELIKLVQEKKNVFREGLNTVFFNEDSYLTLLINKVSKQTSIPKSQLLYVSADKIHGLLLGNTSEPEGENGDDYVIVRDNSEFTYFFGAQATKFIEEFISSESRETAREIKGVSVSKVGYYKGRVKKVTVDYGRLKESVQLLSEAGEGFILVTESTVPEMISVMSRAQAIVTDMGGMLSHAAITARELNIPCVIGTKIATQILKEGDFVEVDADNGIIKILS